MNYHTERLLVSSSGDSQQEFYITLAPAEVDRLKAMLGCCQRGRAAVRRQMVSQFQSEQRRPTLESLLAEHMRHLAASAQVGGDYQPAGYWDLMWSPVSSSTDGTGSDLSGDYAEDLAEEPWLRDLDLPI